MSVDFAKMQEIFLAAVEHHPPEGWAAYLEEACGADDELRRQVGLLLKAHREAGSMPGTAARKTDPMGAYQGSPAEIAGSLLGPYKLLEQIGEGGMGVVWMAEQMEPIQRRVAVKVVKEGMDSKQVLARFEAERQALALMDHPNIAKVFDADRTPSGRPYFVMELVKGKPITTYCDEKRLAVRERLELLGDVCRAVQHAHQKGIIHRDLKPSNVLVAPYDGKPVVKVIDFGVAKAAGQRLTDKTLFTGFGALVGTPEYMSPEQAEVNNQDIDTRSDVYSLGVLLYELLTGSTPLTRKRIKEAALLEVLRVIREEEPPKPSTRLSDSKDSLPSISGQRQTEPAKLTKLVRGELDWIVMKALEKDRNRRYETAAGLARDIERYLHDEPVQACPPSVGYRVRKYARRNKARLAIAGLILFFLVLLGGGGGWVVRDRAAREEEVQRDRAARQAALEERVAQALNEAAGLQAQGKWPEALAATRRSEELLAAEGSDELRRQARQLREDLEMVAQLEDIRMQGTGVKDDRFDWTSKDAAYAQVFQEHGFDFTRGASGAEMAQRIRAKSIAVELAAALDCWVSVCRATRPKTDTAWKGLLAISRAADPDPFRNQLRYAWEQRDVKELARLAASKKVADVPAAYVALLAGALADTGAFQAAVDLRRRAQQRHPADFWINHELATALSKVQPPQLDEAISYYRAALALRPQSPGVHVNLGKVLHDKGRLDEAVAECQEAIRLKKDYAAAHYNLGMLFTASGRLDEAIAAYREAARLKNDNAWPHHNLGNALSDKGRLDEAIAECREAIRLDKDMAIAHSNLGNALSDKGRLDEAIAAYQDAIRLKKDYAEAHFGLGNTLYRKGRLDEAIAEYRQASRLKKDFAAAHYSLGNALRDKGRLDEAVAQYQEAIRLKRNYPEAHVNLGNVLADKGRLDEAIALYQEALRLKKDFPEALCELGHSLLAKGQFAQGLAHLRRGHEVGSRNPSWRYPSAQWVRDAERLVALDDKLPDLLSGKKQPADTAERLALAKLCQEHKKRYAAAAGFYAEAFAADPKFTGDRPSGHRYNAACVAALAGCGQGKDAKYLDDKERARLRRSALEWLRADLAAWRRLLEKEPVKARPAVMAQMQHWLKDPDFAGVRGSEALERLPAAERADWQRLWQEVEELRRRTAGPAGNAQIEKKARPSKTIFRKEPQDKSGK